MIEQTIHILRITWSVHFAVALSLTETEKDDMNYTEINKNITVLNMNRESTSRFFKNLPKILSIIFRQFYCRWSGSIVYYGHEYQGGFSK